MSAVRVELGDEEVGRADACRRERSAAERDRRLELAGDDGVAPAVDGDAGHVIRARIAEALAPHMVPGRVELHVEDVLEAATLLDERAAAEVDRAQVEARNEHVARRVDGDALAGLRVRRAEALAPEV